MPEEFAGGIVRIAQYRVMLCPICRKNRAFTWIGDPATSAARRKCDGPHGCSVTFDPGDDGRRVTGYRLEV